MSLPDRMEEKAQMQGLNDRLVNYVDRVRQLELENNQLQQQVSTVEEHTSSGRQFNRKHFGLSFGSKNGLRFHFDSETCLNYPFLNIFLV